jgi:hypothetical protein
MLVLNAESLLREMQQPITINPPFFSIASTAHAVVQQGSILQMS